MYSHAMYEDVGVKIPFPWRRFFPGIGKPSEAIKFVLRGASIMCPGLTSPGGAMEERMAEWLWLGRILSCESLWIHVSWRVHVDHPGFKSSLLVGPSINGRFYPMWWEQVTRWRAWKEGIQRLWPHEVFAIWTHFLGEEAHLDRLWTGCLQFSLNKAQKKNCWICSAWPWTWEPGEPNTGVLEGKASKELFPHSQNLGHVLWGFHSHGGTPIAGWFTWENPLLPGCPRGCLCAGWANAPTGKQRTMHCWSTRLHRQNSE